MRDRPGADGLTRSRIAQESGARLLLVPGDSDAAPEAACASQSLVYVVLLPPTSKASMLKITIIDAPREQRLVLEGRLAKPDLAELEATWQKARTALGTRKRVIDLRNTTFIDESAERSSWICRKKEHSSLLSAFSTNTD